MSASMKIIQVAFIFAAMACGAGYDVYAERKEVLALAGNPAGLEKWLVDEKASDVARRTAFRLLAENFRERAVELGVRDKDAVIRTSAVGLIGMLNLAEHEKLLVEMLRDEDARVRYAAFHCLREMGGGGELARFTFLMNDSSSRVRESVNRIIWPLFRKNQLLKDDPNYDYPLTLALRREISMAGRICHCDPQVKGVGKEWHSPGAIAGVLSDGNARNNEVEFHRIEFELHEKDKYNAVELVLHGLPENSWAYLNGVYLGQRNLAPSAEVGAWRLNIAAEVRMDGKNVLVVRILNSARHNGFAGPLVVECFK